MPSATDFVLEGGRAAVSSFHPCHIFGDGDIYGQGVRISFYVQYLAAMVALLADREDDIIQSSLVLTIVSVALFINLCVNSTGDNLVILDWSIILALVFFAPVYSIWRPLHYLRTLYRAWRAHLILKQMQSQSHPDYDANAVIQIATIEYFEFRLIEVWTLGESDDGQLWLDYEAAVEARYGRATIATLPDPQLRTINDLIPSDQLEAELGDEYQRQLARLESFWKAHAGENEGLLQTLTAIYKRLKKTASKSLLGGFISFGLVLLSWSAYMAALPWLFFFGINRGTKESCDIKTMEVFFVPISIYNRGHVIFLRVSSIMNVIAAAIGVVGAIICFWAGTYYSYHRWQKIKREEYQRRWKEALRQLDMEEQKPKVATKSEESKEDRRKRKKVVTNYHEAFETDRRKFYWYCALPVCFFVATAAIVVAQKTIDINRIDLRNSSITSPSQLYPLLLSIFSALPVFFHALKEPFVRKYKDPKRALIAWQDLKKDEKKKKKRDQTETQSSITGDNGSASSRIGLAEEGRPMGSGALQDEG